uniref:LOW QUALITY PROTEIN: beta/gamma crystallin domain-containing protein 1 n=1 Tax=Geotrypetes seraphini TaxID=260995 RepID=A0A6P8R5J2_GEOSA|nr:LOW QUALITY PROTEIN: beta/gamma crystallin domain-containing protein 1 [Geotrypetes seraphini]
MEERKKSALKRIGHFFRRSKVLEREGGEQPAPTWSSSDAQDSCSVQSTPEPGQETRRRRPLGSWRLKGKWSGSESSASPPVSPKNADRSCETSDGEMSLQEFLQFSSPTEEADIVFSISEATSTPLSSPSHTNQSRAQSAESPRKEAAKKPALGKFGNLFSSTRRRSSKGVPGSPVSPSGEAPPSPSERGKGGRSGARDGEGDLQRSLSSSSTEEKLLSPMPLQQAAGKGAEKNGKQAASTPGKKGPEAGRGRRSQVATGKPKSPAANMKKPPLSSRGSVEALPGAPQPDPEPKPRRSASLPDASPATVLKVDIYLSKTQDSPLSPEGTERERRGSLGSRKAGRKRKPLKSAGDEPSGAERAEAEPAAAPGESELSKQPLPGLALARSQAVAAAATAQLGISPAADPPRAEDAPAGERRRTRSFGKKPEGEPEKQQQQQHTVSIVQGPRLQGSVFTVSKPTVTSQISLPPKPKDVDLNLKTKSLDDTESAVEKPIYKGNTASKISLFENKSVSHSQRQIDFPTTKNLPVQKKYVGRAKLTFGKLLKDNEQPQSSASKQNIDQEVPRNGNQTVAEIKSAFEEASKTKTSQRLEAEKGMVLKKKEKMLLTQVNPVEPAGSEPSLINKDNTIPLAATMSPQNNNGILPENNQKNTALVSKPSESIKHKMMEDVKLAVSPVHEVDSPQAAGMSLEGNASKKVLQVTENSVEPPENRSKKHKIKSPSRKTAKISETKTDNSQANQLSEAEPCVILESVGVLHPTEYTEKGKTKPGEDIESPFLDVGNSQAVPLAAESESTLLNTIAERPDEEHTHTVPLADVKSMQVIEAVDEPETNKTILKSPKKKTGRKSAGGWRVKQVPAVEHKDALENDHLSQLLESDTFANSSDQTKTIDMSAEEIALSEFKGISTQDGGEHLMPLELVYKSDISQDTVLQGNQPVVHQPTAVMDNVPDLQQPVKQAALETSLNQISSSASGNVLKELCQKTELQHVSSTESKENQILDPSLSQNITENVPIQQEAELDRSSAGSVSIMSPKEAKMLSEKATSQSEDKSLETFAATHSSSSSKRKEHSDLLLYNSQQDATNVQPNEGKESLMNCQSDQKDHLPFEDGTHSIVFLRHSHENIFDTSEQNNVLLNNLSSGANERTTLQSKSALTLEEETCNDQEQIAEVNPFPAPISYWEDNAPPLVSDLKQPMNSWTQNADIGTTVTSEYVNDSLENNLFGQNVWCSLKTSKNIFNVSGASDDSSLDSSSDMERFTEIIRRLDSPMTVPQKRKKQRPARPPIPSFGLPPIHEDYLEKIFDSDSFTFGLGKKDRSQDLAPALLLKMHNSELSSKFQPKHGSKEQSILFKSLRLSTNNEALATEEIDGKENDTGGVEIKRSRLENSKIYSSLQAPFKPKSRENVFSPSVTSIGAVTTTFTVSQNDSVSTGTAEFPSTNYSNGTPRVSASMQENGNLDKKSEALSESSNDHLNPSMSALKNSSCMENGLQTQEAKQEQKIGVQHPENRSERISTAGENTDTYQMPSNGNPETDNYGSDFPLLTPEAEMFFGMSHEKINPRPGKVVIYSEPNLSGTSLEVYGDVPDCTSWTLSPEISIRVVRGCWLLYEKPDFEGLSIPLEEGEMELTNLWGESTLEEGNATPAVIGSLRHVVKDYRICQIDLFTEPEGLGLVTSYFDDTEDIQGYGKLQKTCSIKVHWGTWLIYEESGFQGIPFILEPGEYPDLSFWDTHEAYIGSMRPMKMGGRRVETPSEPKIIVYEKPFFEGKEMELEGEDSSFEVNGEEEHEEDELTEAKKAPFTTVGSMRVLGGVWVAYEKPGFEGHQYLLEEGDYQEWSDWGGFDNQLQSLRPLVADFSAPHIIMYTEKEFGSKGSNINVLGIVSNLDDTGYGLKTRSINVLSGVWVAYEGPDFTGEQYILEKGMYPAFEDWGAKNCRISSIQPVILDNTSSPRGRFKVQLFSEPEFKGVSKILEESKREMEPFTVKSCRVLAGSWVAFDEEGFSGNQFVLEEGAYPDVCALGCQCDTSFRSLQTIDFEFSEPSIVLYGKENYKGKKIEVISETVSQQARGYSLHTASVEVLGGIWIVYEYSHYRGHQKLLSPSHIPRWSALSGWQSIGSLRPLIQKRPYFRIRNQETGMFMSSAGSLDDLKLIRIQVTEETGEEEQIWLYQDGFIKCQIAEECCLAASGALMAVGSKLGLSLEQNSESQCWSISPDSKIYSRFKPNLVLDVKGGVQYDQKHVILNTASEDKLTQRWELLVL